MPRPSDVNAAVLRPANVDPPLTGLQQVGRHPDTLEADREKELYLLYYSENYNVAT